MKEGRSLNVVYIFTDQQRYDTMSVYGNDDIKTPNLNELAKNSIVFDKAYVSQPVCTPSRATMVTGLYPHSHGLIDNNLVLDKSIPTIADIVKEAGYRTGYIGKWHLGNETVTQHGFEEWVSTEDYFYSDVYSEEYKQLGYDKNNCSYHDFLIENGFMPDKENGDFKYFSREFATRIPEQYSKPAFIAGKTKDYIKMHKNDKFVLYVNFLEPHPPYYSVYDDMYDPDTVKLPGNFMIEPSDDIPLKYKILRQFAIQKGRHEPMKDEKTWRKLIARYMGAISLVDKYTGEIIKAIKDNGIWDDTIIVFTSDHGDMMGDFNMHGKGIMYEPAVRVPMLIKIPGKEKTGQKIIKEPVSQIDIVPTLLDMLACKTDCALQGKSLYPAMLGETELDDNNVFIEYHDWDAVKKDKYGRFLSEEMKQKAIQLYGKGSEVRTIIRPDGWKMTLTEAGENELYDLNKDPHERVNLYNLPGHEEIKASLRSDIIEWMIKNDDHSKL